MAWFEESQDHLPLTWWKGKPIYLAAILALAGGASVILTALLGKSNAVYLEFSFANFFLHFWVWTPVTYVLLNGLSLWLILSCILLWMYGEGVERHLGRRAFARLVVALVAVSPLIISLLGLVGVRGLAAAGMQSLSFGVFVAFATLYPRAQISIIVITLEIWILAAVLVGVSALSALTAGIETGNWAPLLMLAGNVGVAYGFVRYEQGRLKLPSLKTFIPTRAQPARPAARAARSAPRPKTAARTNLQVDDILDKISREGMHSLTAEERVILERASNDLQKRKP